MRKVGGSTPLMALHFWYGDLIMKIEEICRNVSPELKEETETLARAVGALKDKIEQQIPTYKKMTLATPAKTTQGDIVLKNNPAMQEFRGIVRDYAAALKYLSEIIGDQNDEPKVSELDELRSEFGFRIAK